MEIRECMSKDVRMLGPDDTVQDAAKLMAECDTGVVPINDGERLVGMVTDRDLVVRALCEGKGGETPLRDVMSPEILYCFEDEDIKHVAKNMADVQVRRLPVMNRDKRLVGIVSVGDLARSQDTKTVGSAMCGISRPGGAHDQVAAH
ncbi:MAG: CBS domain-containing protein [Pseudomonadota bacterium]